MDEKREQLAEAIWMILLRLYMQVSLNLETH